MAHNYRVLVPFCGYAAIEVEAANEEDAERVAFENVNTDNIVELDFVKAITAGNIFRGSINYIETEYLGEVSDALDLVN
jgi:hypothetical protein